MPVFKYRGVDRSGKEVKGVISVSSKSELLSVLKNRGIYVYSFHEEKRFKGFYVKFFERKRFRARLSDIFFQISLLLKSGVPLVFALRTVADNIKDRAVSRILLDIADRVASGERFSAAIARYSDYFGKMYVGLIKSAEDVGGLSRVMFEISEYEKRKEEVLDRLRSAMIYPFAIFMIGMAVVGFLLTFVVPRMRAIFSSLGRELPFATKVFISFGEFMRYNGLYLGLFILFFVVLLRLFYLKSSVLRLWFDGKIFGIGVYRSSVFSSFCHNLSFLIKEGIPIVEALDLTMEATGNEFFKRFIVKVRDNIKAGLSFSEAASKFEIFPEIFVAAVKVGEETGNLSETLEKISEFYERNVEKFISTFVSLVEPMFILIVGAIVGFIVISIMIPLFELQSLLR